jgi:hypothetical protein
VDPGGLTQALFNVETFEICPFASLVIELILVSLVASLVIELCRIMALMMLSFLQVCIDSLSWIIFMLIMSLW